MTSWDFCSYGRVGLNMPSGPQPGYFSRKPFSWGWDPSLHSPSVLHEAIYSAHQFLHLRCRSIPHNTSTHGFAKTPLVPQFSGMHEDLPVFPGCERLVGTARVGRVLLVISHSIVSWKWGLRRLGTVLKLRCDCVQKDQEGFVEAPKPKAVILE